MNFEYIEESKNNNKFKYEEPAKDYIGERPGIDNPALRSAADWAITGAEIAAPIATGILGTPLAGAAISPFTTAFGEFIKSKLVQGEDTEQALKEGALGAAIDVGTMGLGKYGVKPVAKFITKSGATAGMGKVAKSMIGSDLIKYTKPLKESIDDIAKKMSDNIFSHKKTLGQLVGSAKESARGVIDKKKLVNSIDNLLLENQIVPVKGTIQKGLTNTKELKEIRKLIDKLPQRANIKQLFDTIENIDDFLKPVYGKELQGESASLAQNVAKKIRGIVSQAAKEASSNSADKSLMEYANFMDLLNSEGGVIKSALKTNKGLVNLVTDSVKRGNQVVLENLAQLDNMLPGEAKFLDDVFNKLSRENLEGLTRLYPSAPGLKEKLIELTPRLVSKGLRASDRVPVKIGSKAVKIGLIDLLNSANNN